MDDISELKGNLARWASCSCSLTVNLRLRGTNLDALCGVGQIADDWFVLLLDEGVNLIVPLLGVTTEEDVSLLPSSEGAKSVFPIIRIRFPGGGNCSLQEMPDDRNVPLVSMSLQ